MLWYMSIKCQIYDILYMYPEQILMNVPKMQPSVNSSASTLMVTTSVPVWVGTS